MPYRGHIMNGLVVLDEPVSLPNGTTVTVEPEAERPATTAAEGKRLLDVVGLFPEDDLREIEEILRDSRKVDADGW